MKHDNVLEASAAPFVIPAFYRDSAARTLQQDVFLAPVAVARLAAKAQNVGRRITRANQLAPTTVAVSGRLHDDCNQHNG